MKNINGQWDNYIPESELQKNANFDSKNCVVFGTLNCIETILRQSSIYVNYSERYTSFFAGAKINGFSPKEVVKAINKNGVLEEKYWPYNSSNFEQYYSVIPNEITSLAEPIEISCSSIFYPFFDKKKAIKKALQESPLGISVFAWSKNEAGYYIRPPVFPKDNHFCMLYGYEEGKFWKVFDSYESVIKLLDWDYPFQNAYKYSVLKKA